MYVNIYFLYTKSCKVCILIIFIKVLSTNVGSSGIRFNHAK